jgi:hypothetical protein
MRAVPLITKITGSMHCILITINSDNDKNGAQNEFIFAIAFDGIHTQTYGGTTFLTHHVGGSGCFSIWYQWWLGSIRTTAAFVISSVKTQQILVPIL